MPRRRNPPAGVAHFSTLTAGTLEVHELRAGFDDGTPDDNAEHEIHGQLVVSGADDTVVLRVEQRAAIQDLLSAGRLEVGMVIAADPASPYDDPYAATSVDLSGPYADPYAEVMLGGSTSPPERTGFTVDEKGNVRMSGFEVVKNALTGLVLRAPDGRYWSFAIDAAGQLATTGQLIGAQSP